MMSVIPSPSQILKVISSESKLLHAQLTSIIQLLTEIKEKLDVIDSNKPPF